MRKVERNSLCAKEQMEGEPYTKYRFSFQRKNKQQIQVFFTNKTLPNDYHSLKQIRCLANSRSSRLIEEKKKINVAILQFYIFFYGKYTSYIEVDIRGNKIIDMGDVIKKSFKK